MGTQQDMLDLFQGDADKLDRLDRRIAEKLGFDSCFDSVGQVYPRSLDHDVASALVQVAAGPASLDIDSLLGGGDAPLQVVCGAPNARAVSSLRSSSPRA